MVLTATGKRISVEIDPVAAGVPLKRLLNRNGYVNSAELREALRLLGYDASSTQGIDGGPLIVKDAEDLFDLVQDVLYGLGHEQLHVASLNRYHKVLAKRLVYKGDGNSIPRLEPRDVFRDALVTGAEYVVLFHNHPSGYTYPSRLDKRTTKDMCRVGKILGIEILDHIICHNDRAFSMRLAKMLPKLSRKM